jgi:regulatory protein
MTRRSPTQGEVTAIRLQSRNKDRVNVELDGEFAFGLAKILAVGLKVGQHLGPERVAELQAEDEVEEGYRRAAKLIARRPRSVQELRHYLRRKDVSETGQEGVLERLRETGLADDQAFAKAWVENRTAFRPRGAAGLRAELRKKGVSRQAIESALSGLDEDEAVYRAAQKAARRYQGLAWQLFQKRMRGYLARRGFNTYQIRTVIPRVWREVAGRESEDRE